MRAVFTIGIGVIVALLAASASAQQIEIRFKYSNADAPLEVFGQTDKNSLEHLIGVPDTTL